MITVFLVWFLVLLEGDGKVVLGTYLETWTCNKMTSFILHRCRGSLFLNLHSLHPKMFFFFPSVPSLEYIMVFALTSYLMHWWLHWCQHEEALSYVSLNVPVWRKVFKSIALNALLSRSCLPNRCTACEETPIGNIIIDW